MAGRSRSAHNPNRGVRNRARDKERRYQKGYIRDDQRINWMEEHPDEYTYVNQNGRHMDHNPKDKRANNYNLYAQGTHQQPFTTNKTSDQAWGSTFNIKTKEKQDGPFHPIAHYARSFYLSPNNFAFRDKSIEIYFTNQTSEAVSKARESSGTYYGAYSKHKNYLIPGVPRI